VLPPVLPNKKRNKTRKEKLPLASPLKRKEINKEKNDPFSIRFSPVSPCVTRPQKTTKKLFGLSLNKNFEYYS
jgi:hypothetical protein